MAVYLDFLVIPTPVLRSKVPDSAKITYGVIYALSQLGSGGCTASNETIMQIAAIESEDTFKRLLRALEDKKLIKRYFDSNGRRLAIRPLVIYNARNFEKPVENQGKNLLKSGAIGVSKMNPRGVKNDTRERKQEKESINSRGSGKRGAESMKDLLPQHSLGDLLISK